MKKTEKEILKEEIQYLFTSDPAKQWSRQDICDMLGYRGPRRKYLIAAIEKLESSGFIRSSGGMLSLGETAEPFSGKLAIARTGCGFVTSPDGKRTVKIPAAKLNGAIPGDVVEVLATNKSHLGEEGRVVDILERKTKLVTGTFFSSCGEFYAIPTRSSITRDIRLKDAKGAKDGDRIVVELKPGLSAEDLYGEIAGIIGSSLDPSIDTKTIIEEFSLPGDFSRGTLLEAESVASMLENPGKRMDIRDKLVITIDPTESKDFDDAISLEENPGGGMTLGVHIADVSHFVRPGSRLDAEARKRGNSVYLADKVIPMLPEQLSNHICSLNPDADRLAFSVFMQIGNNGKIESSRMAKTVIRSKFRLDYKEALCIIEGRDAGRVIPGDVAVLLKKAHSLAEKLRSERMKLGALNLDIPEARPTLNEKGEITGFVLEEQDAAHSLIEEFMVAANEAVARKLANERQRTVSRLHEPPAPEKIDELTSSLSEMGFRTGDIHSPANLASFIASISNHPLKNKAHTLILRAMRKAVYSSHDTGHFGLAKKYYLHFTSPIRRYADLVVHRQLAAVLDGKGAPAYPAEELGAIACEVTEREEIADESERTLLEIKKYRFLQHQIDSGKAIVYDAVVSAVTPYGLFVDIPLLMVGGLVHISAIGSGFARHNRSSETIIAGGRRYYAGMMLKVSIAKTDINQKRLDLVLEDGSAKNKTSGAKGRKQSKKRR